MLGNCHQDKVREKTVHIPQNSSMSTYQNGQRMGCKVKGITTEAFILEQYRRRVINVDDNIVINGSNATS